MDLRIFPNGEQLADGLSEYVADLLAGAIARDGLASIALSGGGTPERMMQRLSQRELDWARVTATLVDERCVDERSGRSNAGLVRRALLQGRAAVARFVPLYREQADLDRILGLAEQAIEALPGRFTVVMLGMGEDGHTASFFPGGDRLAQAIDPRAPRLVELLRAAAAIEPRLTLTLPRLLASDRLILQIEGDRKKAVLERALEPGLVAEMPIRAMLRQDTVPLEVWWCP